MLSCSWGFPLGTSISSKNNPYKAQGSLGNFKNFWSSQGTDIYFQDYLIYDSAHF